MSISATIAMAIPARNVPGPRTGSFPEGTGDGAPVPADDWVHGFIPTSNIGPVSFVLFAMKIAIDLLTRRMPGVGTRSIGNFA
jgi:hypothetical protein